MQFLQQLKKRVWRLIKYAFVYTAIAILIIFSFSTIYYMLGIENPYQMSEDIFWGIAATPPLRINPLHRHTSNCCKRYFLHSLDWFSSL